MAQRVEPNHWRGTIGRRTAVVIGAFLLWAVAIEGRLVHLQVIDHERMAAEAEEQQSRNVPLLAPRGDILDRHGDLLAYSVDLDTIGAAPREAGDPRKAVAKLCAALGDCTPDEVRTLVKRFNSGRGYVYVRRKVTPEEARRVRDLNLPWVVFHKEPRRFYPNLSLAAHVLGYVGLENNGLAGLESTYDQRVRGRDGLLVVMNDGQRRTFSSTVVRPPVPGASLELTIDRYLQYIAERELRAGVAEHRARGGAVVIMAPHTGEILAIANSPSFNPNVFTKAGPDQWRNRAVQDIYEPGSTFKMVTASAALETGAFSPNDVIDTGNGVITLGSRRVTEYEGHRYGALSLTDVMVKSSNVGAIKIGFGLGAERLGAFVKAFGFGTRLCPDFPGENAGMVWAPERWSQSSLMSVSMGYEIGVTPLQMAVAASTIANGGELIQPRVVRAVIEGNRRIPVRPKVVRRVISPRTAATLVEIMEAVVERGTAKAARIEGYTVAGKTGTAAKLVNRYYSRSDYNASFVGFLPSRQPALTILVVIDTPRGGKGYAGGVVAAPIFQRIAEAAVRYLGLPPNVNPLPPLIVGVRPRPVDVAGPATPLLIAPVAGPLAEGQVRLPELRGLSGREAMQVLARLGIGARVNGDGVVVEQTPLPGTPVEPGTWCRLSLSRATVHSHPVVTP